MGGCGGDGWWCGGWGVVECDDDSALVSGKTVKHPVVLCCEPVYLPAHTLTHCSTPTTHNPTHRVPVAKPWYATSKKGMCPFALHRSAICCHCWGVGSMPVGLCAQPFGGFGGERADTCCISRGATQRSTGEIVGHGSFSNPIQSAPHLPSKGAQSAFIT